MNSCGSGLPISTNKIGMSARSRSWRALLQNMLQVLEYIHWHLWKGIPATDDDTATCMGKTMLQSMSLVLRAAK